MKASWTSLWIVATLVIVAPAAAQETDQRKSERAGRRQEHIQRLRQLGATVFTKNDEVTEVNANRKQIADEDLALVAEFSQMTDLSLEETAISDAGLVHLHSLHKLEWLNLYRSRIGDQGLKELSRLKSLQHLPIGETQVTDAGLAHLSNMKQLRYVGLRGNNVTDDGVKHLRGLAELTGLHLGETKVTDAGLTHLAGMKNLHELWLDETNISDKAIVALARLTSLRELHIVRTKITPAGAARLRSLLPRCRISVESRRSTAGQAGVRTSRFEIVRIEGV